MPITEPFVLPADVTVIAVSSLPPELSERLDCTPDSYAVTRHGSRTASSVIDGSTARLLERFRIPTTIVDAVLAFSRAEERDPRTTLEESFPVLGAMITDGVLVSAQSPLADPIASTMNHGERLGDLEIIAAVHLVVDTEVFHALRADGGQAAVKLARPGSEDRMRAVLAHEATVLRVLDGEVTPALVATGEHEGRPWIATTWCAGVDAVDAAAEHRATGDTTALLQLIERILAAYVRLHARSVLHGDIHPRNVLVDAAGTVTIVDFGLAALDELLPAGRGGVDLFLSPEAARARLERRSPPAPTAAGEQYALAALAFLLITGEHTHRFSLQRDDMLRQLCDEPPLPFEQVNRRGLASVEAVLSRALAKDPAARFEGVAEMLAAFRSAASLDVSPPAAWRPSEGRRLLSDVVRRLTAPDELLTRGIPPPTASATNGAAGFAYALLRLAWALGDADLLAAADLWVERAARWAALPEAFTSVELDLVQERIGERSYHHHEAGVHAVRALVAAARDDDTVRGTAVEAFVAAAGRPCPQLDVSFGRAGLLLGCASLLELPCDRGDPGALIALGDRMAADVVRELDAEPPVDRGHRLTRLGAAHGWAGWLYALLRWYSARGTPLSASVPPRLDQLAALARHSGRAAHWPLDARSDVTNGPLQASWCNGAAGFVPLWLAAHAALGDDRHLALARAAAWTAFEHPDPAPGDLCCGFAGRAYALLAVHHQAPNAGWLNRARLLAERAAPLIQQRPFRRDSLYKGDVGVALLMEELRTSAPVGHPLYARDEWGIHG